MEYQQVDIFLMIKVIHPSFLYPQPVLFLLKLVKPTMIANEPNFFSKWIKEKKKGDAQGISAKWIGDLWVWMLIWTAIKIHGL